MRLSLKAMLPPLGKTLKNEISVLFHGFSPSPHNNTTQAWLAIKELSLMTLFIYSFIYSFIHIQGVKKEPSQTQ